MNGMEPPVSGSNQRQSTILRARPTEYWGWFAVALFLLLTVDLLTSMYAAAAVGLHAEANPIMAWLLVQPLWILVGTHVVAAVVSAIAFEGILRLLNRSTGTGQRLFAVSLECWLGCLVAFGLFLFANNVSVIVHGMSLL